MQARRQGKIDTVTNREQYGRITSREKKKDEGTGYPSKKPTVLIFSTKRDRVPNRISTTVGVAALLNAILPLDKWVVRKIGCEATRGPEKRVVSTHQSFKSRNH